MSAIPSWTVLPVIALALAIVVGRWILVDDTAADRAINRALTWYVGALALYGAAAAIGWAEAAQRLYLGCSALACASLYGFTWLLNGGAAEAAPRRQRRYDSVAAVTALAVLVGPMELVTAVWVAWGLPVLVSGLLITRACVRELRTAGATTHEKVAYSALLIVALHWVLSAIIMTVRAISGTTPQNSGIPWIVLSTASFVLLAALIAVPLVIAIMVRTGWDRNGRACRRLQPLWKDLTAAVPEVVLRYERTDGRASASRLYRMTVEIGDALMHLRQFAPDDGSTRTDTIHAYALRIAEAAELKRLGTPPSRTHHTRSTIRPPADDRSTELRNLLALSREWPRARAAAAMGKTV